MSDSVGYFTEHDVHIDQGDKHSYYEGHCSTCGWVGTRYPKDGTERQWERAGDEVVAHRAETREFVAVEPHVEPGVVFAVEDQNYDFSGLGEIFDSLYAALVAYPHPWLERGERYWSREDGDAIKQTAMSISAHEVRSVPSSDRRSAQG